MNPTDTITRNDHDHTTDVAYVAALALTETNGRLDPVQPMRGCTHTTDDRLTTTLLLPEGTTRPEVRAVLGRLARHGGHIIDTYLNPLDRWLVMVEVVRNQAARDRWEAAASQPIIPGGTP